MDLMVKAEPQLAHNQVVGIITEYGVGPEYFPPPSGPVEVSGLSCHSKGRKRDSEMSEMQLADLLIWGLPFRGQCHASSP